MKIRGFTLMLYTRDISNIGTVVQVSKEKAIIIASNHNNIPIQKAKAYTDSELREVLRHLNLKPGF